MPYQVYATDKNGEGMVQDLGLYDEVEDITIKPAMFANDVIITIEQKAA